MAAKKAAKTTETKKTTAQAFPLMRKISAKAVMEKDIKSIAKEYENGSSVELFTVLGEVVRCQPITTQYGDSMRFRGKFRVQRAKEFGEKTWDGPIFFAPGDFENELITAFQTRSENQASVRFAAKVSIIVDDDQDRGYVYNVEPLIEAVASDTLDQIANEAGLKSLAAPVK